MAELNKTYFSVTREKLTSLVDDATASDLHLDEVFEALDGTRTTPGQSVLYAWIRNPCENSARLQARSFLVDYFRREPPMRARTEALLSRLGKQQRGDVGEFLWGDSGDRYQGKAPSFRWVVFAEVLVLLGSAFLGWGALLVILGLSLVNLGLFLRTTKYIARFTESIGYLGRMVGILRRLSRRIEGDPPPELTAIRTLTRSLKGIRFTVALFPPSASIVGDLISALFEYYRIFLLGELRAYFAFHAELSNLRDELKQSYEVLGKLDAALAILALEEAGYPLTVPQFIEGHRLEISDMCHPLVEDFVPLSVALAKNSIVTGTNMAGKSTFLRTLGVNQILATTINLVFAQKFHTGFFRVVSALEISDDLLAGKSRYLAQAERILAVIGFCEEGQTLALIDEILSGTNSTDRIQASVAILGALASFPSVVVSSTHDLEIARSLAATYGPFFFSEILDHRGLEFDYQIHPGIVDKSNALRILRHLGFSRYLD